MSQIITITPDPEEYYRCFMELSPMPIGIQAESRWVYLNKAAVKLLGAIDPDIMPRLKWKQAPREQLFMSILA